MARAVVRAESGRDVARDADDALQELAEHVLDAAAQLHALAERARALRERRRSNLSWDELVLVEDRPLIVEQLSSVLDSLGASGARFRRAEAAALAACGLSHSRIAGLFGVTRQRVGVLLAPAAASSTRPRGCRG